MSSIMSKIFYFGIFTEFYESSINNINHYEILLKVRKIDNKTLEVIDILHYDNNFFQSNMETFILHFKSPTILSNTIIEFEDNNFNNIIKLTHPKGVYPMYTKNTPIQLSFKTWKIILLDNLDKIKENIIKNNKILCE